MPHRTAKDDRQKLAIIILSVALAVSLLYVITSSLTLKRLEYGLNYSHMMSMATVPMGELNRTLFLVCRYGKVDSESLVMLEGAIKSIDTSMAVLWQDGELQCRNVEGFAIGLEGCTKWSEQFNRLFDISRIMTPMWLYAMYGAENESVTIGRVCMLQALVVRSDFVAVKKMSDEEFGIRYE